MATLTPWASWAEWHEVCALLFAEQPASRAQGVARVAAWRQRSGSVPLAVDATAVLTELRLFDQAPADVTTARRPSEQVQCLTYAMAITRLVNGVIDPLQRSVRASSIRTLAHTMGLPASLVELRHESTHNRLPAIGRLVLGADEALVWLHGHYWAPQHELRHVASDAVRSALDEYRRQTLSCSATAADGSRGAPPPRKHVLACALALDRALHPSQLATHLVPALLDGGFLSPQPADGGGASSEGVGVHGAGGGKADAHLAADAATAGAHAIDDAWFRAVPPAAASAAADTTRDGVRAAHASLFEDIIFRWSPLLSRLGRLWSKQCVAFASARLRQHAASPARASEALPAAPAGPARAAAPPPTHIHT